MTPWMKWAASGLVLDLLAAGTAAHTLSARKVRQNALEAQQAAQKTLVSIDLAAADLIQVKARVPGELRDLTVREGDTVRADQVLASSQANLASAQANHAAAHSGADLAAKALDDTVLRAPLTGQISRRLAQTGERVAVAARVVEIVDNRQLELETSLNANDSLQVKVGQSAQLQLDGAAHKPFNRNCPLGGPSGLRGCWRTISVQANVVRINPSAVTGSRAVLIYLALAPSTNLRHGLFAQGALHIGQVKEPRVLRFDPSSRAIWSVAVLPDASAGKASSAVELTNRAEQTLKKTPGKRARCRLRGLGGWQQTRDQHLPEPAGAGVVWLHAGAVANAVRKENQDYPVGNIRSSGQDRVIQIAARVQRPAPRGFWPHHHYA